MAQESGLWALECTACNARTQFRAAEGELEELYRAWPHVAALRTTGVLQADIDDQETSSFMEEHALHNLRAVNGAGETRPLAREAVGEAERLWKAIYFAAGIIDEYEKAIRRRPELVQEGFCQSDLFRNALAVLRKLAAGTDDRKAANEWNA